MTRLVVAFMLLGAAAHAEDRLAFWNLTSSTVTRLVMAPAGTGQWGPNQCANDNDGAVDHDERLKLTGVKPGRYDVKLTRRNGQVCTVRNVDVKGGGKYAFSLSDNDLTDCQ